MQIRQAIIKTVVGAMVLLPSAATAQSSSLNTFSPYTLYGIGDLSTQGTANLRSMGGAGVAYRDTHLGYNSFTSNYLNPASYSAIPQKSFIFNFELEGANYYLKDQNTKSSFNTFNIRDIGILFPLAKRVGFSFSVTPYSSVGYRMERVLKDQEVMGSIGDVRFLYDGEGDITQIKAGLGTQLFKNFSIGAEAIYYKGYLDRGQVISINSITGGSNFTPTYAYMTENISRFFFNTGFQYNAISNAKRVLTIGGTYRVGGKLKPTSKTYIPSNDPYGDTVYFTNRIGDLSLPDVISGGIFYHTSKISVGADYVHSNWGNKNKSQGKEGINYDMNYINTHSVKGGLQYTPNRFDSRKFMKRLTYRIGARYDENYMTFGGQKLKDKAVTAGIGIPMRTLSPSYINVGLEYGQSGTMKKGLIKANYFKISIGFSLFGEDYWFMKEKYK